MEKGIKMLIDNKLCEGSICVLVTTWNAFIGAKYITVYGDSLYITPIVGGIYGVNLQKTIKVDKQNIADITVNKSIWTGSKIIITLNNGRILKYKLPNGSWLEPANRLVDVWFLKR